MTRDFTWEGVNRNLKVSVITPNGAVYDMVQQMTRISRRIEPSQVILINGARKGAKLQIAEAVRSEVVAFFAWEPMATKLAASYPQVQVYVIQPSVLDLLRCIYFAPKGGKLGAIIPFALRDYYDDLEDALQVMDVSFHRLAPAYDERELRDLIRRAASQGVTDLIGTFDTNVWELLKNQPWPGNVRQLAHIIERLVLVVKNQTIQVKDVLRVMPRDVVAEERGKLDEEGHLRGRTYEMIEKMSREGKSGAQIAKALGISRSTVYRIKRRHEDQ